MWKCACELGIGPGKRVKNSLIGIQIKLIRDVNFANNQHFLHISRIHPSEETSHTMSAIFTHNTFFKVLVYRKSIMQRAAAADFWTLITQLNKMFSKNPTGLI